MAKFESGEEEATEGTLACEAKEELWEPEEGVLKCLGRVLHVQDGWLMA